MALTLEQELRNLLTCLCTALGEVGWEGDCCVEPGVPSFDTCCEAGGQAWARLIEVYPTSQFPERGRPVDPTNCEVSWAMVVELGAVTCVCVSDGGECGCTEREADAAKVLQMEAAALTALACCGGGDLTRDVRVVGLEGVGPGAGCAGFNMQVITSMTVCCPPEEP